MKAVHKILVPGDGKQLSVSLACDEDIDDFFFFLKGLICLLSSWSEVISDAH